MPDEKKPDHKSELAKRCRSRASRIDILTHQNILELGKVRDRMQRLVESVPEEDVRAAALSVNALIENHRQLVRQLKDLQGDLRGAKSGDNLYSQKLGAALWEPISLPPKGTETGPAARNQSQAANRVTPRPAEVRFTKFRDRLVVKLSSHSGAKEVLDFVYDELRTVVPFSRMGFAAVDEARQLAVWCWERANGPTLLNVGYSAPMATSSLQFVLEQQRPRVLHDLPEYFAHKPQSESTRILVDEEFRSALTCPLLVNGRPIGFLFFTSDRKNAFSDWHVSVAMETANLLGPTCLLAAERELGVGV